MSLTRSKAVRRPGLMAGAALAILVYGPPAFAADTTTTISGGQSSLVANAPAADDTHTVEITASGRVGVASTRSGNFGSVVLSGTGDGQVVVNTAGRIGGRLDFAGLEGGLDLHIESGGAWRFVGMSGFSVGSDSLTLTDGGVVTVGVGEIAFGAGDDVFTNAGVLIVGPRTTVSNPDSDIQVAQGARNSNETQLDLTNLETFEHSGSILLGGYLYERPDLRTDRWHDDILSMPGADYVGDGGEIVFDVNFAGGVQNACDPSLRNADGDMPTADCVAIVGGSTSGTTAVTINSAFPGDRGGYDPVGAVLVDVSGGTSHAGDFVLGENSENYSAAHGGIVDKGVFFYALVYNEDAVQHRLVSLAGGDAAQFPLLASVAQGLWRVSTGSWLDRQADLRADPEERSDGVWMRASGESADRDVAYSTSAYGTTFAFDNTFSQSSYAVTGGLDLLSGAGGDAAYAIGVMAGYAHSEVDYDASPNTAQLDGWTGGVYASFITGGLFVDAALNANKADLKNDIPSLNLFPADTILKTELLSVGGQVEAGWRIPFRGGAFVEPLASVVYVKTEFDELEVPADDPARAGLGVEFDDPTSLRASIGGRVGFDHDYGGLRVQYSVLGRLWNEFEGENGVLIHSPGPDALVVDDFGGQFTELGFGASVYAAGGAVSGFLDLGGKFGDDYQATIVSAGVRFNW